MKQFTLLLFCSLLLFGFLLTSCKSGDEGSITITGGEKEALHWTKVADHAGYSPRKSPAIAAFDNRMWVIGGYDNNNILNDVWYSYDGIAWTDATSDAAFSPRVLHKVVTYNNKMYLIGGKDGSADINRLNDVWSSNDGINWILETSSAAFPARENHSVLVFNNQMWVIGGLDTSNDIKNDVWFSSNGYSWASTTLNAAFPPREFATVFVHNNQMWYAGGVDFSTMTLLYDSWYSTDGMNWFQGPDLNPDIKGNVTDFRGQLYSIGGRDLSDNFFNEVWKGNDIGDFWRINPAEFSPREPNILVFNDKIWVLGGETKGYPDNVGLNDIWHTQ